VHVSSNRAQSSRTGRRSAARDSFPGFVEPALATLRAQVPEGDDWIHEIKYDGYRTQAHLRAGRATLFTRRGFDWTDQFRGVAEAIEALDATELVLDGEVIVQDDQGIPDFAALQSEIARRRSDRLTYCVFDILYLDGRDLRRLPVVTRKQTLANLISDRTGSIAYSSHLEGDGAAMLERACDMRLEGVVSKLKSSPYISGRTENWIKTKCAKRDAFPIVAFVEKLGAKPRRIASLYLGRWEGKRLLYAGKARSGYSIETAQKVRELLDRLITNKPPLNHALDKPKATWVRPEVEADVTYSSITTSGLLREPVFKGIAAAKSEPAPSPRASMGSQHTGSVPRENILQLLPDAEVPSDEELMRYWRKMGKKALQYLGRRLLKLVRHVDGVTFYHKGPLPPIPPSVHQLKLKKREGGEGTRVWVDDLPGLLGLVRMGAVELHPWNATVDDIEHPDYLVFDLDPGDGVDWDIVVDTALAFRALLESERLDSWPKVTGGKGIHVMVPIEPQLTHDEAHRYAKGLARRIADLDPSRYTLSAKEQRSGKLFIDYLRNGRGTTAVGTYSPRARQGIPVAAPVSWKQVEDGTPPNSFTLAHLSSRPHK
jgi:bifunctional non-homologous end joining protein LigD